jgi:hypothetical protein
MIVDPPICVRCYIVPILDRGDPHSGVVFEGFPNGVKSIFNVILIEEP